MQSTGAASYRSILHGSINAGPTCAVFLAGAPTDSDTGSLPSLRISCSNEAPVHVVISPGLRSALKSLNLEGEKCVVPFPDLSAQLGKPGVQVHPAMPTCQV